MSEKKKIPKLDKGRLLDLPDEIKEKFVDEEGNEYEVVVVCEANRSHSFSRGKYIFDQPSGYIYIAKRKAEKNIEWEVKISVGYRNSLLYQPDRISKMIQTKLINKGIQPAEPEVFNSILKEMLWPFIERARALQATGEYRFTGKYNIPELEPDDKKGGKTG